LSESGFTGFEGEQYFKIVAGVSVLALSCFISFSDSALFGCTEPSAMRNYPLEGIIGVFRPAGSPVFAP
jgi:hypothetical protein